MNAIKNALSRLSEAHTAEFAAWRDAMCETTPRHFWTHHVELHSLRCGVSIETIAERRDKLGLWYAAGETVGGAVETLLVFEEGRKRADREDAEVEGLRCILRDARKRAEQPTAQPAGGAARIAALRTLDATQARAEVLAAVDAALGNRTAAAGILGVAPRTLFRWLSDLDLWTAVDELCIARGYRVTVCDCRGPGARSAKRANRKAKPARYATHAHRMTARSC